MPIYDYVCRACGHVVEVIHAVDAAGPSECPVCGGEMRRALSAPAVHFKGSGWAKKERAAAAKPAEKSSDSTSETSSKPPADAAKSTAGDSSSTTASTSSEAS